jgi:spore coat polysaccharide biosynthesis protein SpsF
MDKAIAIIQARMSSSRLPGKVLKELTGKPIILHIYHRAMKCRYVDKVIIATSTEQSDDELADYCEINNLNYYRGSLNNVIQRYIEVLKKEEYKYYVRITGDCPLIHPEFIDNQIMALNEFKADTVWCEDYGSALEGQGAYSVKSLLQINNMSTDARDLEHVGSPYMTENPDLFKIVELKLPKEILVKNIRLSIDEYQDYLFFKNIYDSLYDADKNMELPEVLKWLKSNPHIIDLNNKVTHRPLNLELKKRRMEWLNCKKIGVSNYKKIAY